MSSATITINGQPVAYAASAGDGPAALLIQGNSSSGRSFQRQLESELGARHRLVAIDLPGLGRSQPVADPGALGLQGWAATVRAVVGVLGLDPVVLVGWSLGGHVALEAVGDMAGARGVLIFGTPPIARRAAGASDCERGRGCSSGLASTSAARTPTPSFSTSARR